MSARSLAIALVVVAIGVAAFLALTDREEPTSPGQRPGEPTAGSARTDTAARVAKPPTEPWAFVLWALDTGPSVKLSEEAARIIGTLDSPEAKQIADRFFATDEDGRYEDEEMTMRIALGMAQSGRDDVFPQVKGALEASDYYWEVAEWAANALALLPGDEPLKLLLRLAVHEDEDVRESAGVALATRESALAGDAIKVLMKDEFEEVAALAAGLLVARAEPGAGAAAEQVLEQEDEDYDAALARGLGVPGNPEVLAWLDRLLAREELGSRIAAAKALGATKLPGAQDRLRSLLESQEPELRTAAAASIALNFGAEASDDTLRSALVQGFEALGDPALRGDALQGLVAVATPAEREIFAKLLANPQVAPDDHEYRMLQLWAAQGLLELAED